MLHVGSSHFFLSPPMVIIIQKLIGTVAATQSMATPCHAHNFKKHILKNHA